MTQKLRITASQVVHHHFVSTIALISSISYLDDYTFISDVNTLYSIISLVSFSKRPLTRCGILVFNGNSRFFAFSVPTVISSIASSVTKLYWVTSPSSVETYLYYSCLSTAIFVRSITFLKIPVSGRSNVNCFLRAVNSSLLINPSTLNDCRMTAIIC